MIVYDHLAVAPSGDLYVSDGYGNARVHRFNAEGELIHPYGGHRHRGVPARWPDLPRVRSSLTVSSKANVRSINCGRWD